MKVLFLLSAAFLVRPTFLTTADGGDCVTDCMQSLGCFSGGMGNQNCGFNNSHGFEMCNIQCKGKNAAPAHGAIAFSLREMISGWSYNQPDRASAEKMALQYCAKSGGANCVIQASFHNTCGAIATTGKELFWGISGSKYNAEQRVLAECTRAGKMCTVQASICSSPGPTGDSDLGSTSSTTSVHPPAAPAPAPRATSWGAIAYSSGDMGAGWSQGKNDQAAAEREALAICAQRGKACVVKTTFNKQCGALAADRDITGIATSTDQREALQKALDECKRAGGTRCVPHISFCSL
jgi:hypothetical protein